jgi:hypothetical protein
MIQLNNEATSYRRMDRSGVLFTQSAPVVVAWAYGSSVME